MEPLLDRTIPLPKEQFASTNAMPNNTALVSVDEALKSLQISSDEKWNAANVRRTYIDFFVEKKGHEFYASSSVIPFEDPTLLFINSGMCQYKPIFLGVVDPATRLAKLKRAVNTQKCIRAGVSDGVGGAQSLY